MIRALKPSVSCVRSCAQTKYNTEPGRYSQRTTVLERYCLKSNAPGSPLLNGRKRSFHCSARAFATCSQSE